MKASKLMDYSRFISRRSARRKPSPIRELQPLLKIPGMISLGGGMPNSALFPFDKISVTLKEGSKGDIDDAMLAKGLQYSPSYGLPELVDWLKKQQTEEHKLSEGGVPEWDICVTTGSQDAMSKAFDMLCNEGDYIITENPTYSGAIAAMQPLALNLIGIDTDENGMQPEKLEKVLSSWDFASKPLRVIYTIPTGQNPSGATLSLERRKQLYQIASKYDLVIIEDDPYYYLQLPPYKSSASVEPLNSLLSMDKDGRVLRFDSFSKIMSSGLRLGWVTGPKVLVERIQLDQQASALHPCGLSQVVLLDALQRLGKDGLTKQISQVQKFYAERRDAAIASAEKHRKGLAECHPPSAGMFLWFKLIGVENSYELIMKRAVEEKFLMLPGQAFAPDQSKPSPFVRASFSTASFEEMDEAMKRLANLLKKS
eukprot:TRINITY_DN5385_c0_g1_i1.p1 TRINITY_DN5385_c0_g1~~TRINITY_DN5385_c0_g1_i1.p1  ORF type:complete len:426 (-),score=84.91 TRINITY_DN5385_c0_g1_i1:15-1292(-)